MIEFGVAFFSGEEGGGGGGGFFVIHIILQKGVTLSKPLGFVE